VFLLVSQWLRRVSPFRRNPGSNLGLCKGFFFLSYDNFSPKIAYLSKNFTSGTRVPTRVPVVMARSSIRRVPGSNLGLCKGFFFLSYGNFSANLIGRGSTQSNIHGIGIAMECSDTSLRTLNIFDLPPSAACLYGSLSAPLRGSFCGSALTMTSLRTLLCSSLFVFLL